MEQTRKVQLRRVPVLACSTLIVTKIKVVQILRFFSIRNLSFNHNCNRVIPYELNSPVGQLINANVPSQIPVIFTLLNNWVYEILHIFYF